MDEGTHIEDVEVSEETLERQQVVIKRFIQAIQAQHEMRAPTMRMIFKADDGAGPTGAIIVVAAPNVRRVITTIESMELETPEYTPDGDLLSRG